MSEPAASHFRTTRWSIVLHSHDQLHTAALNQLCLAYWRPLYAYCRRSGSSAADAEDLTQGFFAKMLADGSFSLADPARGKFRTFLLASFRNYMRDAHRESQAQKRGGGMEHLALDSMKEDEALIQASPGVSAELAYDQQWAHDVVRRAKAALTQEYQRSERYELYLSVSSSDSPDSYEVLATRHSCSLDTVKSFALRVRRRYRALLEQEIADTVALPTDVGEEMRYLVELLRS